jgi:hypothetical protein
MNTFAHRHNAKRAAEKMIAAGTTVDVEYCIEPRDGGRFEIIWLPKRPIVTSHANRHYQKRFDLLAEFASIGDWDAIRRYECNGVNSYSKMVRRYRDCLIAAHEAR